MRKLKFNSAKRPLLAAVLSLLLCGAMLLGTTFAWFTDSVSSSGNIIRTGNLKVGFLWAAGSLSPTDPTTEWTNAADSAIFAHENWEPGYTEARHLKIVNNGSLALNYKMRIVANGTVGALADAIEVYLVKVKMNLQEQEEQALTRDRLKNGVLEIETLEQAVAESEVDPANAMREDQVYLLGSLAEVLGTQKNLSKYVKGSLPTQGKEAIYTIALRLPEGVGDDYQNQSLGCTFSFELLATQMSSESDSFGSDYDANVPSAELPAALVRPLTNLTVSATYGIRGTAEALPLDAGYLFEPTATLEDAQNSIYRYWHADFVVKADKDVPANSIALAGYYNAFCKDFNDGKWVALTADTAITAGTEIRLVQSMADNLTVNWEELCHHGNYADEETKISNGFHCGLADVSDEGVNLGTTVTVELRLYETEAPSSENGNSHNVETGNYVTVGTFTHTFTNDTVNTAEDLKKAIDEGEAYVMLGADIDLGATQLAIPENKSVTLNLNGYDLKGTYIGDGDYAMFTIPKSSSLTVVGEGEVSAATAATENNSSLAIFLNNGNLTINGGTYNVTDMTVGKTWIIATIVDNRTSSADCVTKLTINGGDFSVSGNAINLFRNYPQQGGSATLTVNGGVFHDKNGALAYIWNQESQSYEGKLIFNGGLYDKNVVYKDYGSHDDIVKGTYVEINAYEGNT